MLPVINIRDSNFFNRQYPHRHGTYFSWHWDEKKEDSDITVFTDEHIKEAPYCNSKVKIAWLVEPPSVKPHLYQMYDFLDNKFNFIFSYYYQITKKSEKFLFCPYGGTWVYTQDRKIYKKTKKLSIISSLKNSAPGHKIRIGAMNRFKEKMDLYGRGHNEISNKLEGLKEYMFSIAIENMKCPFYFTEKLLDCFLTGTIPIYWGSPNIERFFDTEGIIKFKDLNELDNILNWLSPELYYKKIDSIKRNFSIASSINNLEDNLWVSGLNKIIWEVRYE